MEGYSLPRVTDLAENSRFVLFNSFARQGAFAVGFWGCFDQFWVVFSLLCLDSGCLKITMCLPATLVK